LLVNAAVAAALYKPFGIAGVVIGTVVGTVGMTVAQGALLRPELGGIEGRQTAMAMLRMLIASVGLAAVAYGIWWALDEALGRSFIAQVASLGTAIAAGVAVYAAAVVALRVDEAKQIRRLIVGRFGRRQG
jgi:putative peptidoglycan lipid II flippase